MNQAGHAIEAALTVQSDLKMTLENLALELFGPGMFIMKLNEYD